MLGVGPSVTNPITGEIISADVVNKLLAVKLGYNYRKLYGYTEDNDPLMQYITNLTLHEVGHTLGLRHNFRGSQLYSPAEIHNKDITGNTIMSSVMDYDPINIAPEGVEQGIFFSTVPGVYDKWAIKFGYTPNLSDEERKKIIEWIESEVFRFDPDNPDPGRVTIRRLNRTEYNNTIRDLMMVDFDPADDFPPDDTGYGFDNIGDVLSLSPVLLEKYLNASDQITSAAIRTSDPPEKIYKYEGSDLIGGQPKLDGRILGTNGSVKVKHKFLSPGKYSIKISAGADQAGDEPAKMSVIIDGKKIKTVDVENRPEDAKPYELILFLDDTKEVTKTIDARFINDFYDLRIKDPKKRDRNLFVN